MIHYGRQWIAEEDIQSVAEVLRSDFLTQGPIVHQFEKALAAYVGSQYAVAFTNGTAALHIAVAALKHHFNIEQEAEGITSPNTFVASANCLCYNQIKPHFADIDDQNYSIDPNEIKNQLNKHTRILIPVHFAGQACDMEAIAAIKNHCSDSPLYIIEDACHAIGSTYENGKKVGSCCYSEMTVFSFHPVKTIATGEGGVVTTNDKNLYEQLTLLRNHGITKEPEQWLTQDADLTGPWYYEMQELGFNYRMTEMQAALGVSQLKKIDGFISRRREIIDIYNRTFKDIDYLTIPYEKPGLNSAFHLYVLKFDFQALGKTRTQVMEALKEKGIGTQVHYIPVHLQPYYRENFGYQPGDFPRAESYYSQCLSIPLFPKMTDQDIQNVIDAIKGLL